LATWQADGSPYFTAIIRDVSERQRMQDELERALAVEREATARLSELDRLKNTLLDAVSHDLRGPLAAIRAATTVLQRDAEKPGLTSEQRRGYLTRLKASADKMRRLLDDLLDLDRLSARDVSLQRQPTDVGQIARRLVEEHRDALGERAIDLNLESVIAEVDAAVVERIIENLLLNACRHTRDGTALGISALRRDDDVVVICIDDSGPGVPEALHGVIFERFKQAPGSSTTGLGMGLSLVARLAQLHGGRAWVENRPSGGASFRVALPLKAEQGRLP
jgi:signal transduction histidine kinase